MAYIEKRKNGYRAQVRRRGMPSISRTFDLKVDAEAWAREVEREAQRGSIGAFRQEAQKTTIQQVAEIYEVEQLPRLRGKSSAAYLHAAKQRFGPYFLAAVRSVDVAQWLNDLSATGLSPQSVAHHRTALASLFTFARKRLSIDLPGGNPALAAPRPATPKGRDRRLRKGEEAALLAAAAATGRIVGLREAIILAIETSMRLSELLGLEWSRVDLQCRTAHLVDTKNGESRTVALSSVAVEALRSLPRRIDGRVFGWKAPDSFEKAWTRCKARAQAAHEAECAARGGRSAPGFVADLRFHDLRHEATSRLFEKGLGVMEVASMTGHKSLSMLKRYTHIEAEKLAKKLG